MITGAIGHGELVNEYQSLILSQNPVAYYRHEAGEMGTDSSGNSNNASVVTNVSPVAGTIVGAGDYNGTDSKLQIPNSATLQDLIRVDDTTGKYASFSFIMEVNTLGSTQHILSKDIRAAGGAYTDGGWDIYIDASGLITLVVPSGDGANWSISRPQIVQVTTATWYHVVIILHRSSSNHKIYINNVAVLMTVVDGVTPTSVVATDSGNDLYIGCRKNDAAALVNFFDGILDEVAIFDRQLTVEEIAQQFVFTGI